MANLLGANEEDSDLGVVVVKVVVVVVVVVVVLVEMGWLASTVLVMVGGSSKGEGGMVTNGVWSLALEEERRMMSSAAWIVAAFCSDTLEVELIEVGA